jgi:hypothetical protein
MRGLGAAGCCQDPAHVGFRVPLLPLHEPGLPTASRGRLPLTAFSHGMGILIHPKNLEHKSARVFTYIYYAPTLFPSHSKFYSRVLIWNL